MVEAILPQSPLWATPGPHRGRGIVLQELGMQGHLNLRGDPGDAVFLEAVAATLGCALPLAPNTVAAGRPPAASWLGPDEWLLRFAAEASAPLAAARLDAALAGRFYALSDLSSAQTVVRVSGERALEVLAKGCTLDLHPRVFDVGHCAQTNLAQAVVTVFAPLPGEDYEVVVRRSFADYLMRWLLDASR